MTEATPTDPSPKSPLHSAITTLLASLRAADPKIHRPVWRLPPMTCYEPPAFSS